MLSDWGFTLLRWVPRSTPRNSPPPTPTIVADSPSAFGFPAYNPRRNRGMPYTYLFIDSAFHLMRQLGHFLREDFSPILQMTTCGKRVKKGARLGVGALSSCTLAAQMFSAEGYFVWHVGSEVAERRRRSDAAFGHACCSSGKSNLPNRAFPVVRARTERQ